ncbi:hypothetical protein QTP70_012550 [Hemibagrus guttatus]|uniref:Alkylated DNA repair protein AlkB homologue 8 N-terminal domain-containing protein n=1 Tax=Hemibagrus guttatus TaxID=175788 RepID=A0AAE0UTW1_9TELE|nr:hypothetical protein QTP70_012550 [Hemibagrus guttatus]
MCTLIKRDKREITDMTSTMIFLPIRQPASQSSGSGAYVSPGIMHGPWTSAPAKQPTKAPSKQSRIIKGYYANTGTVQTTGSKDGQTCVLSPLLYSLYTYDCVATTKSTTIIKFADDTVVVRLISDNNETAYLEGIRNLENWCQRNNLLLNDLSWSCHINTVVKKARQHLYHLRRLRDFRLPSKVLRKFYSCTIGSILTGNIATWFGNSTMQDRRALKRVMRSADAFS